jgi:Ion channel
MLPRRGRGGIEGIDETTEPDTQPAGTTAAPRGRFGLLLLLLVGTYVMNAFGTGRLINGLQIVLFAGAVVLALRNSSASRRTLRLIVVGLIAGTAIMLFLSLSLSTGTQGTGVANIWAGLILLFAVIVIVRRVLSFSTASIQSIYGVLSAYLIIGLMFASFYAAIDHLGGGHFFAHSQPDNTQTYQYFSFTTLTTLGYGDFTAADSGGRAIAVLEALTGQIFLVTLVARLVAAYRGPAERQR